MAPPPPEHTAEIITTSELHALLTDESKIAGRDYVVVDVRRTDIDVGPTALLDEAKKEGIGAVRWLMRQEAPGNIVHTSAINLPAQTFYHTLPVIYEVLHRIPLVIFHCNSCRGRGPRCAGWYTDELARRGCTSSKALTLEGGLNAWREAYPDLVKLVANS